MYLTFRHFNVRCISIMRILGLKPSRINEWWAILKLEGGSGGIFPLLGMVYQALRLGVTRTEWRTRLRTCSGCPIYNSNLRQCRSPQHPKMGCGCYVPYLAMTRGACWGRINTENLGWD